MFAGHLIATFGKLLLFGLDHLFPEARIFSASGVSKLECFQRLKDQLASSSHTGHSLIDNPPQHHLLAQQTRQHDQDLLNKHQHEQQQHCTASSPHPETSNHLPAANRPAQSSSQSSSEETLFLAIGDGREESGAAKLMGWPFLHINLPSPTPPCPLQEPATRPDGFKAVVSIQRSSTAMQHSTAATPESRTAGTSQSLADSPDSSIPASSQTLLDAGLQARNLPAAKTHHGSVSHCKTPSVGHAAESNMPDADLCGRSADASGAQVVGSVLHLLKPTDLIQLALQG